MSIFLNDCTQQVLAWAKKMGWDVSPHQIPEMVALLHSECSEALEAFRNHEPLSWTDEHGKPQGVASEFADIFIRLCHYSAVLGINLEAEYQRKMDYNHNREYRHGGKAC